MRPLIVTGTDTGVGKTVVSAMLTLALGGFYWKPIQSGTAGGTDSQRVAALTGLPPRHFIRERYLLREPLSPHRAAELDGVEIDPAHLLLPDIQDGGRLIIEGAGGVLVPITRGFLQADLFASWGAPAVLVARTSLGTINHSLLSLEALRRRSVPVLGIVFVGDAMEDAERTILDFGKTKRLGRLPFLKGLDAAALRDAFAAHFDARDFEAAHG
jgi:dethiobiotin synthase